MDPALEAAARALSAFDSLGALRLVALRDEPHALALRGVAMAQLGDYGAARSLLVRASRALEGVDTLGHARCLAALGEVALARRDLAEVARWLEEALAALEANGDRPNGAFVRLQQVRRLVLVGAIADAATLHRTLDLGGAPPRIRALSDLIGADIAVRMLDPGAARAALGRAMKFGRVAAIPSLVDEIDRAARELDSPVARAFRAGEEELVNLDRVGAILRADGLVVDACRRTIREGDAVVSLVTRPVLLALAVTLARAWPGAATRESLAAAAFGARRVTESVRVRLRVEIGRLRRAMAPLADLVPLARASSLGVDCATSVVTSGGYALRPRGDAGVVVLLPPAEGEASALLALLRGGESWSTSALASAMGTSQRTVQRALMVLRDQGRVEGTGSGRSQRWVARPPEGFATTLLLVVRGQGR